MTSKVKKLVPKSKLTQEKPPEVKIVLIGWDDPVPSTNRWNNLASPGSTKISASDNFHNFL